MKKIEALMKRSNRSSIINQLKKINYVIIDVQNLTGDCEKILNVQTYEKQYPNNNSISLSKLEIAVSDKNLKKASQIITKHSGLSDHAKRKSMFVTTVEMPRIKDISVIKDDGSYNINADPRDEKKQLIKTPFIKRNRMVSLQQLTVSKTSQFYEKHKKILQSEYGINSYSDFINYCIQKYLVTNELQIKCDSNLTVFDKMVNYAY
ncbi:MAG: hypothetical protein OEL69_03175 [Nitrosopumilus sp.]|nr:hypothetical protein [Nitrosopumilus sp.]